MCNTSDPAELLKWWADFMQSSHVDNLKTWMSNYKEDAIDASDSVLRGQCPTSSVQDNEGVKEHSRAYNEQLRQQTLDLLNPDSHGILKTTVVLAPPSTEDGTKTLCVGLGDPSKCDDTKMLHAVEWPSRWPRASEET